MYAQNRPSITFLDASTPSCTVVSDDNYNPATHSRMWRHWRGKPVLAYSAAFPHTGRDARTRSMAGPKPFQSAPTPSAAMVLRAQSAKPLYVPVGADCRRDLSTSGGIAIAHIATPAMPPAKMTAPRLRSAGDAPAGVTARLVTSYAAKYLRGAISCRRGTGGGRDERGAARAVAGHGREAAAVDAPHAALFVQLADDVSDALVLVLRVHLHSDKSGGGLRFEMLTVHLQKDLRPLHGRRHHCSRDGREEARDGELGDGKLLALAVGGSGKNQRFRRVVCLSHNLEGSKAVCGEHRHTQNETANIGVTPSRGGTMPRYILRYVSFAKTGAHQGLPGHAILGQGLLHHVHGTSIRPGRCGLEACLR
jgi:hypothetical protein